MLGYTAEDVERMINAVHDARLYYHSYPSDIEYKQSTLDELRRTMDLLMGLLAEGHVR